MNRSLRQNAQPTLNRFLICIKSPAQAAMPY
jgi:hypothetical protein